MRAASTHADAPAPAPAPAAPAPPKEVFSLRVSSVFADASPSAASASVSAVCFAVLRMHPPAPSHSHSHSQSQQPQLSGTSASVAVSSAAAPAAAEPVQDLVPLVAVAAYPSSSSKAKVSPRVVLYSLRSMRPLAVLNLEDSFQRQQELAQQQQPRVTSLTFIAPNLLFVHTNVHAAFVYDICAALLSPSSQHDPLLTLPTNSLNFCKPHVSLFPSESGLLSCERDDSGSSNGRTSSIARFIPENSLLLCATVSIREDSDAVDLLELASMRFILRNLSQSTANSCVDDSIQTANGAKTGMVMCVRVIVFSRDDLAPQPLKVSCEDDLFSTFLVVAYESGNVVLYRLSKNDDDSVRACVVWNFKAHENPVTSLDVSPSGTFIITGAAEENFTRISTFEIIPLSNEGSMPIPKHERVLLPSGAKGCTEIKFRHDSKLIAIACWDSNVRLYSAKSLQLLGVLGSNVHKRGITCIEFGRASTSAADTSDLDLGGYGMRKQVLPSNMVAVGTEDGRVVLWQVY
ncbi:ASTRA complex subunit [Entophlyctis sp. JEL0112]|nr:ASTRA complex subunit [Entophlyctis sp. JEL0112]